MKLRGFIFLIICTVSINSCFFEPEWISGKYYSLDTYRHEYFLIDFEKNWFRQYYTINDSTYFNEGKLLVDKKIRSVGLTKVHDWEESSTSKKIVVIKNSGVQFKYKTGVLSRGELKDSYAMEGYEW